MHSTDTDGRLPDIGFVMKRVGHNGMKETVHRPEDDGPSCRAWSMSSFRGRGGLATAFKYDTQFIYDVRVRLSDAKGWQSRHTC